MLGEAPAPAATSIREQLAAEERDEWQNGNNEIRAFCVNIGQYHLLPIILRSLPPWLCAKSVDLFPRVTQVATVAFYCPGEWAFSVCSRLLTVTFRSHQWLRGQVSHYLFLLIVYSALMWWSSWSARQEVEAKWHGGENLASVGTGQELMQLSCSRWHMLTFLMIIESPTLEDCLEMVHDGSNKMATDKTSILQETTQPVSWFFRQITWMDFK